MLKKAHGDKLWVTVKGRNWTMREIRQWKLPLLEKERVGVRIHLSSHNPHPYLLPYREKETFPLDAP